MEKNIMPLCKAFKEDFWIGAAVSEKVLGTHEALLAEHFNSLTAENSMKFALTEPQEGHFVYEEADKIAAFARSHKMKMRGHTLVWHNQTPDWVFEEKGAPASRETVLRRMENHIREVTAHFQDAVYCWDVVNEAVEDKGEGFLRQSKWLSCVGEDFVDRAFETARRLAPGKQLYYNDYNECFPEKREKILRLLRGMIDRGVPVDGFGMQGHWNIFGPTIDQVHESLEAYAKLGLRLQITELDISLYASDNKTTQLSAPLPELLRLQEKYYAQIFALFREYREVIDSVTFWGVADDSTWLDAYPVKNRKNWPLLFDESHSPKSAFFSILP